MEIYCMRQYKMEMNTHTYTQVIGVVGVLKMI